MRWELKLRRQGSVLASIRHAPGSWKISAPLRHLFRWIWRLRNSTLYSELWLLIYEDIWSLNNLFVFSFIHSVCLAICLYSEYMLQTYSLSSTMINVKFVRTKNNNLNCTSFPASIKIFFSLFEAENSASYNYWLSFSKKIHLRCHNGVCIGMLVCILTLLG